MDAFSSATHISVQQVETVEEMRINDSDLKKKWSTIEKDVNEVSWLSLTVVVRLHVPPFNTCKNLFNNQVPPSIHKSLCQ